MSFGSSAPRPVFTAPVMHPVSAESTWIPDAPASNPIG